MAGHRRPRKRIPYVPAQTRHRIAQAALHLLGQLEEVAELVERDTLIYRQLEMQSKSLKTFSNLMHDAQGRGDQL